MPELQKEPLTFEKIWTMFQETDKKFQAMSQETERLMQETTRQMKETDRKIGELGNRFGDLAEHLVAPGVVEKFNALGFRFNRDCQGAKFRDPETGRLLAEVDIHLENGDIVIAVEVKANLRVPGDVDDHLKRMEVLRRLADLRGDTRKYQGAIAAAIVVDGARRYAQKAGFYVLEQSGDTMKLDIPEDFVPREW